METVLYDVFDNDLVQCGICNHFCRIKPGKSGICRVRENQAGALHLKTYPRIVAASNDPIEKKPLYHFLPGTHSFSIACVGCNFKCRFCQNADIAQVIPEQNRLDQGQATDPDILVENALEHGCKSISYTYTEPTVFFELALETSKAASARGLKNIFVTNGYMSPQTLTMAAPYLDAANVDLKAFNEVFYQKQCKARLAPVLKTLEMMKTLGIHIEITTLLIPGLNDSRGELKSMAQYIVQRLGPDTVWHISRFHPAFLMTDRGATSAERLDEAYRIGTDAGIKYIYVGNAPDVDRADTTCHACGRLLIQRNGYRIQNLMGTGQNCPECRAYIPGVFQ